MKSIHIHSSHPSALGDVPYLVLGLGQHARMSLDFSHLEVDPQQQIQSIALSVKALYEVLEGKSLYIDRIEDSIRLESEVEELVIECHNRSGRQVYRVWLAEFALGWNMLCRGEGLESRAS